MLMWFIIMIVSLLLMAASLAYLASRICMFAFVKRYSKGSRRQKIATAAAIALGSYLLITIAWGVPNAFVVALYFSLAWLASDLIFLILEKTGLFHSEKYYSGLVAVIIAISSLAYGWHNAHNVWKTEYNVYTPKITEQLKIAMFADSHTGTTFNADGFARHIASIQSENPDILIVAGDFVDDDTSRHDMIETSRILGEMKTRYGKYLVFGNHDKGYYGAEKRGFTYDELMEELLKNGVSVLLDEAVPVGDNLYVIGRLDYSVEKEQGGKRKSMNELMRQTDGGKYVIVADHQPTDYDNQAESGADLVLSGHTHGGQLFPFNQVGKWIGANDLVYGHERRKNTDFIVTSGISDWAIKFKTGTRSEYVIINVIPQK